jgi:hypothetical protein
MSCVSALAFARETFGLLFKFFERAFQLPRQFAEPFGGDRVGQQLSARSFNLFFRRGNFSQAVRMALFSLTQR